MFNPQPKPEKSSKKKCKYCSQRATRGDFCWKHAPKKKTGEANVFEQIWGERPHFSQISGERLLEKGEKFDSAGKDLWYSQFSHILTKGAYGKLRKDKRNIILKTCDEHRIWEFETHKCTGAKWAWVHELKQELKERYRNL